MNLSARLRASTAREHEQLETLPFFVALRAGTLPAPAALTFLRSLAIIHAVLERALADTPDASVSALRACAPPKLPRLMDDLDRLAADRQPVVVPPVESALEFSQRLLAAAGDPYTLVGVSYVLEGSQQGGRVLKPDFARCLGVEESQLSYVGCYGADSRAQWEAFTRALDGLAPNDSQTGDAVGAALQAFDWFEHASRALFPFAESDLRFHVAGINPEAGHHVMPQDPREVALALRAGRSAWVRYPYLAARFGDRGRRFTSSDSCWLVSLARMPVDAATAQLRWLRGVLASRGIPGVILESHIREIVRAMGEECSDHDTLCARYAPFLSGFDAERRPFTTLPNLVATFDRRLSASAGQTVTSVAALIASAWLDELSGIRGALEATAGWFADPARFDAGWIDSVQALVEALRRLGTPAC